MRAGHDRRLQEYVDGFGLALFEDHPGGVLRFEGDNEAALKRIQADFRRYCTPTPSSPSSARPSSRFFVSSGFLRLSSPVL